MVIDDVDSSILNIDSLQDEMTENEVVDADSEGVDNDGGVTSDVVALPPEWKVYCLRRPTNINYNDESFNLFSIWWSNLIVGARALYNVAKAYVNVLNDIATFVEPTPPTNIILNETILTQCSINQGIQILVQKGEAAVRKWLQSFHDHRFFEPKKPRDITYEQQKKRLAYLMFLKIKND